MVRKKLVFSGNKYLEMQVRGNADGEGQRTTGKGGNIMYKEGDKIRTQFGLDYEIIRVLEKDRYECRNTRTGRRKIIHGFSILKKIA